MRRGPRDDITHYQGIVIDITERKRAEEALRHSRQSYEALVSSVDGIVWEADARTFQFSFVSQQAERLLGYPIERWLTEPTFWKDHIHPDDQEWAVALCTEATRGKRAHDFEYRMMAADGRTVWLRDIVTVVVEHDQPVKVRGVMVDITEHKRAETALRQSEERYRELFENANDVIYTHDLAGNFTSLNKAAEQVTGHTRDEALTMNISQVVAPEHLERARQMIARMVAQGVPTTYE
ncbi:MAG: PAS domain S-box protein, partial [candidate division NC10 bacterium]|nr:PAS domain S-box protein [candidate division NC10 bacterium]